MKYRKLFQAKDEEGYLHYIDNLDKEEIKEKKKSFLCPHCKQKVMPKMGEKNVWHFAHVDKPCDKLRISSDNLSSDESKKTKNILSFTKKFKAGNDFKINPDSCQCEFCKKIQSKKYSINWSKNLYICKECYKQLDSKKIEQLNWKSL